MVIDTSAILAILLQEPEALDFALAISEDASRLISSISVLEASIVIHARKGKPARELDLLLYRGQVEIVAFTAEQAEIASKAWSAYGKGRHPAALNLGDCCSYALSHVSGEPLLYKGADFVQIDVVAAGFTS